MAASEIAEARRFFAEELRAITRATADTVIEAFARVPRERFVGPGPLRILSPWNMGEYWTPADASPRAVYHDVLIAYDEARRLNNGQPSLWAFVFDKLGARPGEHVLHLGCGMGYYTAILAELVGPAGKVTAVEIDATLAERARDALAAWPQVAVINGDGSCVALGVFDIIVASAGATHPLPTWRDALKPGGRLVFPMTATQGPGGMLLVTRRGDDDFAARILCGAAFYEFSGARDAEVSDKLRDALMRDRGAGLKSLRRNAHAQDETCWLHGDGWCLSRRDPAPSQTPAPLARRITDGL
jgi:protein-L-isoaspartate(D-aspartate) O-methyltransferase